MDVTFSRTGWQRYGVRVQPPGAEPLGAESAPGFDRWLPHDLVHFVVEAELGLRLGVFGRVAAGGAGLFLAADPAERKRRARRDQQLHRADRGDMVRSEKLTQASQVLWKARRGLPVPQGWLRGLDASVSQSPEMQRILARLDEVADAWAEVEQGGSLTLVWPHPPFRFGGGDSGGGRDGRSAGSRFGGPGRGADRRGTDRRGGNRRPRRGRREPTG